VAKQQLTVFSFLEVEVLLLLFLILLGFN